MTENRTEDRTDESCQEPDCTRERSARGWCEMHYRRWLRGHEPRRTVGLSPCSVAGCDRDAVTRGWCHGHYQRWWRTGDVAEEQPLGRRRQADVCSIAACGGTTHSHGLCSTHASRRLVYGDPRGDVPIGAVPRAMGGPRRAKGWVTNGYRYVPVADADLHLTRDAAYAAEHRLVMARSLGRPLENEETVHHRNGDRQDNRLENLELWSCIQPSGQRASDKVAFAVELLRRYAPELLA